jgi:hypothetical protein
MPFAGPRTPFGGSSTGHRAIALASVPRADVDADDQAAKSQPHYVLLLPHNSATLSSKPLCSTNPQTRSH